MDSGEFNKEKRRLRELYKRCKVGLVRLDEVSDRDLFLLKKYYGVK
jgi:hypothetical protein